MTTSDRALALALGGVLAFAAALSPLACFQAPSFLGPFACTGDEACGGEGLVCSDGVCCRPTGTPLCLTYVFEDGSCADGGTALTYYEDLDGDGFGNENNPKKYCAPPRYDKVSTVPGDCNDNPSASGELSYPGAKEQCDGRDNNCDRVFDEGFPLKAFYRDQDGDGYGDPAQSVMACAKPVGYEDNKLDCQPTRPDAYPGAQELCNKIDDDCDGPIDEDAPGSNIACQHPTAKGVCEAGLTACVNGAMTCKQVILPSPDYCDTKDNNCDGVADDAPDCGGPSLFKGDATTNFGVKRLADALGGSTTTCKSDAAAFAGAADTFAAATMTWHGVGPQTHVLWAERKGNDYWDLSRPATKMRLAFEITAFTSSATQAWDAHNQPVVLLCGETGMIRYVHSPDKLLVNDRAGSVINVYMPVDPARDGALYPGWVVGSGSVPAAERAALLKRVKRIEILIQPDGSNADFTLAFPMWGFP